MEFDLKVITYWLRDSGLNEGKMELHLLYKKDTPMITITVGETSINSASCMNILGIMFDSKLQWSKHIANVVKKLMET